MSDPATEALRAAVQRAVDARGGRIVALSADVTPDTLYRFLRGEELRSGTRAKLAAYIATLSESDTPAQPATEPAAMVSLPEREYGKLLGRLETTVEWLGSMDQTIGALGTQAAAIRESLAALRAQLQRATSGMAGAIERAPLLAPEGFTPLHDNGGTLEKDAAGGEAG